MMAAYNPTPGGGHPGLPHGHPGMGPNPGQHMGQPMQMHPGVSGAPHVSQPGAMMGMQPGAQMGGHGGMGGQHPGGMMQAQMGGQSMPGGMPNAQAMNHMTPQQHMQQQQAMAAQLQANPALAQQQQMMRMRQQQMLAQQQQNGMMNMHGVQLTPQQMAHLQQQQQAQQNMQGPNQGVQLPQHLAQQMAMRQQQIQQAQAQHQQHMQQQLAMQQANSQQSNQSQSAPQGQQGTPQQMRPQSRMANPNEQTPTQQQQPQQPQSQQSQQSQPQGQQQGQQGQQANQQQVQQQQGMSMQRQQQLMALQRAQRQQAMAAQSQAGQGGMFILRLMNFSDHLSNFDESTGKNIAQWHNFVERHFAPEGRLVHGIDINHPSSGGRQKLYEVLRPSIARYFMTYFDAGASSIRLHTEHARELPHQTGSHQVTCQNAILSVSYPNGIRLEMIGSLQVLFSAGSDAIECFQFQTLNTEEVLTRSQIEKVFSEFSPSLPTKSPKMAKNKLPKAQQKMQEQQERLTLEHFPKASKGTYGIASRVQHFLEIGETMNVMSDLMWYAQEKKLRPEQAMEAYLAQMESQTNGQQGGNPQINLPPNGVPPGQRTPSMGNMQMPQNGGNFSSPNVSNLSLPMQPNGMNGSPHMGGNLAPGMNMPNSHTPSPHQGNMAAPQMMPQHSQQGTNSSVASASTSPNINNTNKRRRSTVKLEGDDGGGDANRVKPSPRQSKKPKP